MKTLGGWLCVADVAARLGVEVSQVLDLCNSGPLVAYAEGLLPHAKPSDVAAFLAEFSR